MDFDDRNEASNLGQTIKYDQTLTAPMNNTADFFGIDGEPGQTTISFDKILDEETRDLLKLGFKKVAKKNDYIRLEDIGLAFRHSGQNPSEDTIKDMIEKAKQMKNAQFRAREDEDEKLDDHLTYPDFLALVHEYWVPFENDCHELQEAFDILDPQNKSKLMVDEFVYLLKTCDWPDEEIELLLSQVSCADGYFLYDDLQKLLITPVELPKKKAAKSKSAGKRKKN